MHLFLRAGEVVCLISIYLTENCGILDNLLPGDQILADRGFNVPESVGLHCAEINSSFYKGEKTVVSS